ncbi:SDR family NAD(P)-dependent oxidoreductase [Nannocystis sp.]|nr:SDR family NAD(P)-dependent oxidoreductase [Nannocystis sp.]
MATESPRYAGALVTGGGSGIGRALVSELLARGVPVMAAALDDAELVSLRAEGGGRLATYAVDLTREGAVDELLAACEAAGIEVELLVNCAGVGLFGEHVEIDRAALRRMITLNATALSDLCAVVGGKLRARGRGAILNVASTASFQPLPRLAAYAASKHFVAALSEALAEELAPYGVQVSVLHPGTTRTAFLAGAGIAATADARGIGRIADRVAMDPSEVAAAAVEGLYRGERRIVPGLGNRAHDLARRVVPRALLSRIFGRLGRSE